MWVSILSGCSTSLEDAYDDFMRGEYARAVETLKFEPLSHARVALEAHVLYWSHRRADAVTVLRNARRILNAASGEVESLLDVLLAASLASCGDRAAAMAALPPIGASRADDIACYFASTHLALGNPEAALDALDRSDDRNGSPANRFFRGWALAFAGDIDGQARCCVEALRLIGRARRRDVGLAARLLRIIAAIARETMRPDLIECVEQHRDLPWPYDLAVDRFQLLRTTAMAHSLRGEYVRFGEEFARSAAVPPDDYCRMLTHLDRAWIAEVLHESVHQRIELAQAQVCGESIDWHATRGEEIGGLLLLAKLTASIDPERAKRYMNIAGSVRVPKFIAFAHDDRLAAFRLEAAAFVAAAKGEKHAALESATNAIAIFDRYGYRWRSASLALLLYRTLGQPELLEQARPLAEDYPRSIVGIEFRRLAVLGSDPIETLTKRQREIVALVRDEGLSNNELALRLSMSVNTVRVHKRKIYRAFNVSNEFQLLVKLSRPTR